MYEPPGAVVTDDVTGLVDVDVVVTGLVDVDGVDVDVVVTGGVAEVGVAEVEVDVVGAGAAVGAVESVGVDRRVRQAGYRAGSTVTEVVVTVGRAEDVVGRTTGGCGRR
jgi:hypothetical protein